MEKKFFKKHFESGNHEWTKYGSYDEEDITPDGDILCVVDELEHGYDREYIDHNIYQEHIDLDEMMLISEKEYKAVINKLREADGYNDKAHEIFKTLL